MHSAFLNSHTARRSLPVDSGGRSMWLTSLAASIVLAGVVALVVVGADKEKPAPAAKARTGTAPKTEARAVPGKAAEKEAEAAVGESARRFVAAYNRHDARTIAAGFTTTAEFITEDGTAILG